MKTRKCPKCRNNVMGYQEVFEQVIDWDADQNGFPSMTDENCSAIESGGNPVCVFGWCLCGHKWRVRGVTQITDIKRK